MIDLVIKWAVPFLCGAIVSGVGAMCIRLKSYKMGLQCLLRAEIIRSHDKYTDRNYCPIYAKESLTRMYKAYHALGGNDVATKLYEECMKLPEELEEEK